MSVVWQIGNDREKVIWGIGKECFNFVCFSVVSPHNTEEQAQAPVGPTHPAKSQFFSLFSLSVMSMSYSEYSAE